MNPKEIIKSPLFLVLAGICVILLCILAFFAVHWADMQHGTGEGMPENLQQTVPAIRLDDVAAAVLLEAGVDAERVSALAVFMNQSEESGTIYHVEFTVGEETFACEVKPVTGDFAVGELVQKVTDPEDAPESAKTEASNPKPKPAPASPYVSKDVVKAQVLKDADLSETLAVFRSITLNEESDPPIYDVVFESSNGYVKYIYQVNALNGLLRSRTYYNADDKWDEGNIFLYYDGDDDSYEEGLWDEGCRTNKGGQSFYNAPVFPDDEVPEGYDDLAAEYGIVSGGTEESAGQTE